MKLSVNKVAAMQLALPNFVYLNELDAKSLAELNANTTAPGPNYVQIRDFVYQFAPMKQVEAHQIALSGKQRQNLNVALRDEVDVRPFSPQWADLYLVRVVFEVERLLVKDTRPVSLNAQQLTESIQRAFINHFLRKDQLLAVDVAGHTIGLRVTDLELASFEKITGAVQQRAVKPKDEKPKIFGGFLLRSSEFLFSTKTGTPLRLEGAASNQAPIFRADWSFDQLGVGGLDEEFTRIFRQAFATRIFPSAEMAKLGTKHIKGILLYGPPGTGKTLLARQITKMLNGKAPKIVRGPEILDKFVGQAEKNIRDLFKEAEEEYAQRGDQSELHVIVMDELDAICAQRGTRSGSTGVMDTVVNQLLASIDGVSELNNILIIGMTNRKDMIDEALLRPGRLGVHLEIGLPDEHGRLQILQIHTKKLRENKKLTEDVDLNWLAKVCKNYTGADVENLVGSATTFAMQRHIDIKNPTKPIDPEKLMVMKQDFMNALREVRPALAVDERDFESFAQNGIIECSARFTSAYMQLMAFAKQVKNSTRTSILSVLLTGKPGSGKSSLAATVAQKSEFPFARVLTAESIVGFSESGKIAKIRKVFEDAHRSPFSVVVIDDIERIVEYVPLGPRFSNVILQTLLVLMKHPPPLGRRMLVIGTTSNRSVLSEMDFMEVFNAAIQMPLVETKEECVAVLKSMGNFDESAIDAIGEGFQGPIAIKKLIMMAEMAAHSDDLDGDIGNRFRQNVINYGVDVLLPGE